MPVPVKVPDNIDGDKPFILMVRLNVKESDWALFQERLAESRAIVKQEGNALTYRFSRAPEAKDGIIEVVGFEEFKSKAALEAHAAGRCGDIIQEGLERGVYPMPTPEYFQEL